MTLQIDTEARATELEPIFETFCKTKYREWTNKNPVPSMIDFIYNPNWTFDHAEERNVDWYKYIVPLAKEWWDARGYRYEQTSRHEAPTISC